MGQKIDAAKSYLFENVLSVASEYGKENLKKEVIPLITNEIAKQGSNLLIDYGASFIPGIGGAVSDFRTNKKINNLNVMVDELVKNSLVLSEKFEKQSLENKKILDAIFEMVLDKIESTSQKDKIRYMVEGYSEFLDLENPSFDVAYLYFDTLDKLTLLDIDVLKLSYFSNYLYFVNESDEYDGPTNYEEILKKYDIVYSQYESIRENLLRLGLFENDYDNKIEKDYKNIEKAIKELRLTVSGLYDVINGKNKISRVKNLTSKSDIKFKAKDKLKISKFGSEFVRYFLVNEESK